MLKGNEHAFESIYVRCSPSVYRFAFHMTRNSEAAQEITQETFIFLMTRAKAFDPERGSLLCFLLGVARNLARRRNTVPALFESLQAADGAVSAGSDIGFDLDRREQISAVRDAIAALPPRYREVVILCELEELDYAAAAQIVGCPTGTVRSRLHRARNMLALKLQARCCV